MRYPRTWSTNDPGQADRCRFFHPEPFEVPPATESTGIAISLKVEPVPFADLVPVPAGSPATEVLAREETTVAGSRAVRAEIRATGEGLFAAGVRGVVHFVDFDGATFTGRTYDNAAAGTFAANTQVLDQMMQTLRRLPRQPASCSASGLPATVPAQEALPAAVAATRAAIVEAAVACDYDALSEFARRGDDQFTFSFGGGDDPAQFWRDAEMGDQPVLRTLVQLLAAPFASLPGGEGTQYVWPSAYGYERWQDVPQVDRDALRPVYGDEDFRGFEAFGSYAGFRIGITEDGDWIFFVGGD